MAIGRPPEKVPQEQADDIIQWISEGKTLREWCRQEGKPSWVTVYNWLEKDEIFALRFARARELGHDAISEECLKIADETLIGERVETSKEGVKVVKEDMLGHRKLQIETRLKLLAKWNPKKYGERVQVDDTNARIERPIKIELVAPDRGRDSKD